MGYRRSQTVPWVDVDERTPAHRPVDYGWWGHVDRAIEEPDYFPDRLESPSRVELKESAETTSPATSAVQARTSSTLNPHATPFETLSQQSTLRGPDHSPSDDPGGISIPWSFFPEEVIDVSSFPPYRWSNPITGVLSPYDHRWCEEARFCDSPTPLGRPYAYGYMTEVIDFGGHALGPPFNQTRKRHETLPPSERHEQLELGGELGNVAFAGGQYPLDAWSVPPVPTLSIQPPTPSEGGEGTQSPYHDGEEEILQTPTPARGTLGAPFLLQETPTTSDYTPVSMDHPPDSPVSFPGVSELETPAGSPVPVFDWTDYGAALFAGFQKPYNFSNTPLIHPTVAPIIQTSRYDLLPTHELFFSDHPPPAIPTAPPTPLHLSEQEVKTRTESIRGRSQTYLFAPMRAEQYPEDAPPQGHWRRKIKEGMMITLPPAPLSEFSWKAYDRSVRMGGPDAILGAHPRYQQITSELLVLCGHQYSDQLQASIKTFLTFHALPTKPNAANIVYLQAALSLTLNFILDSEDNRSGVVCSKEAHESYTPPDILWLLVHAAHETLLPTLQAALQEVSARCGNCKMGAMVALLLGVVRARLRGSLVCLHLWREKQTRLFITTRYLGWSSGGSDLRPVSWRQVNWLLGGNVDWEYVLEE